MVEEAQTNEAAEAIDRPKTAKTKAAVARPARESINDALAENNERVSAEVAVRKKRSQRPFPASTFEEALEFAKKLFEFGSGQQVRRLTFFDHIQRAPESGPSRQLIINAGKYGLISGGIAADFLSLTPDGLRCVDPEIPRRDQARAWIKLAIEDIDPFAWLHHQFSGKALPAKAALIDAVKEVNVSDELAEEAVETFIVNLRFVGLLPILSGAERIVSSDYALDSLPATPKVAARPTPSGPADSRAVVTADHAQFEKTCFYITPIGSPDSEHRKHADLILGTFIEPVMETFGLTVVRADGIDKPGIITRQIIEHVVRSRLVIVDLSYHNPNVFYELALRHMMRLPIVQIVRKADSIPFDINQMRTIILDTTDIYTLVPMIESHRAEISSQIRRALENTEEVETPISTYFPNLRARIE